MPASAPLLTLRHGQLVLLEANLPGRRRETIGVLLYDPASNHARCRLRRDWDSLIPEDEDLPLFSLSAENTLLDHPEATAREVWEQMEDHLNARLAEAGEACLDYLENTLSCAIQLSERQAVTYADFDKALDRLYRTHVKSSVQPYRTHVPIQSLRAAAGAFGEHMAVETEDWYEMPEGVKLSEGMFAARVVGESMVREIPNGSLCLFRAPVVGSRQGKILLIEDLSEAEHGGQRYTVKRYQSSKTYGPEGEWRHEGIAFKPSNPDYQAWSPDRGEAEQDRIRVVAEFLCVLEEPE